MGIRAWSAFQRAGVFQTGVDHANPPTFAFRMTNLLAHVHLDPVKVDNSNFRVDPGPVVNPATGTPLYSIGGPFDGTAGDLIAVDFQGLVQLWFCVRSAQFDFTTRVFTEATWVQLV